MKCCDCKVLSDKQIDLLVEKNRSLNNDLFLSNVNLSNCYNVLDYIKNVLSSFVSSDPNSNEINKKIVSLILLFGIN